MTKFLALIFAAILLAGCPETTITNPTAPELGPCETGDCGEDMPNVEGTYESSSTMSFWRLRIDGRDESLCGGRLTIDAQVVGQLLGGITLGEPCPIVFHGFNDGTLLPGGIIRVPLPSTFRNRLANATGCSVIQLGNLLEGGIQGDRVELALEARLNCPANEETGFPGGETRALLVAAGSR